MWVNEWIRPCFFDRLYTISCESFVADRMGLDSCHLCTSTDSILIKAHPHYKSEKEPRSKIATTQKHQEESTCTKLLDADVHTCTKKGIIIVMQSWIMQLQSIMPVKTLSLQPFFFYTLFLFLFLVSWLLRYMDLSASLSTMLGP